MFYACDRVIAVLPADEGSISNHRNKFLQICTRKPLSIAIQPKNIRKRNTNKPWIEEKASATEYCARRL